MKVYRVLPYADSIYKFNVQVIVDGYYSGHGKFCKSIKDVLEFIG